MTKKLKVAFFGTSDKSTPILKTLQDNFNLVLCVTKTDRTHGRDKEKKKTRVKAWAESNGIPVFEIKNMQDAETPLIKELIKQQVDMIVVADFGFIITKPILEQFGHRIINIHFSLLPKYRGANPVQATIINGDDKTGITFLQMVYELDAGDIIYQAEYPLTGKETTESLYNTLFEKASTLLPKVIHEYLTGKLPPQPQDHSQATYHYSPSHPRSTYIYKEDAKINWEEHAKKIEQKIRAFNPWPIAWTTLEDLEKAGLCKVKESKGKDLTVKVFSAHLEEVGETSKKRLKNSEKIKQTQKKNLEKTKTKDPATPVKKLIPDEVQVQGKNKTSWESFLNGYCQKTTK